MSQNPLGVAFAKNPSGALVSFQADIEGNILVSTGDTKSTLAVAAASIIKATPGRLARIIINGVVGTGGALTLNDCATVGAAAAGNVVYTTVGTIPVGTVVNLDWPFQTGIVVSAVPTGGTVSIAISWT